MGLDEITNKTAVYQSRTRILSSDNPNTVCKIEDLPDELSQENNPGNEQWWSSNSEQRRTYDNTGSPCTLIPIENIGTIFVNRDNNFRDIVILTDESTSITADNFEMIKSVMKNLVGSFCGGIKKETNHVSVLRYSAAVKVDVNLNRGSDQGKVFAAIDNMNYKPLKNKNYPGSTYTAQALEFVKNNILVADKGWRENLGGITTEILIITDGRSNDPSELGKVLMEQKEALKSMGVDIYALGIGNVYHPEISDLTDGNEQHSFYFPTWKDFGLFARILEYIMTKRNQLAVTSGSDASEICLPFTLSEEDKNQLQIVETDNLAGMIPGGQQRRRRRNSARDLNLVEFQNYGNRDSNLIEDIQKLVQSSKHFVEDELKFVRKFGREIYSDLSHLQSVFFKL